MKEDERLLLVRKKRMIAIVEDEASALKENNENERYDGDNEE